MKLKYTNTLITLVLRVFQNHNLHDRDRKNITK